MEVTLSKNGWHRKLQTFVFPSAPMYNSLCPYFWLTVFCFLITVPFPIVPIIKLVGLFFMGVWWAVKKLIWVCTNKICNPLLDYVAKNLPEPEIVKYHTAYLRQETWRLTDSEYPEYAFWSDAMDLGQVGYKKRDKYAKKFQAWKETTPDWQNKITEIRMRLKAEWEARKVQKETEWIKKQELEQKEYHAQRERKGRREERRRKQALRMQKFFTFIVKYTKWLAWVFMAAVIGVLAYFLFEGVTWLFHVIDKIHWDHVWHYTKIGFEMLVLDTAAVMIIIFIFKLIRKCVISLGDFPRMRKFWSWLGRGMNRFADWSGPKLVRVAKAIGSFFVAIGSVFRFIWMYAKATKENYCPAINWVEDEERRKVNR